MDRRVAVAVGVHAGVVALASANGLSTAAWASLLVGGGVVGVTNRNPRSVLRDGFLAGTLGTVLAVLAWTAFLGGWSHLTRLLAEMDVYYGYQFVFVGIAVGVSPIAGFGNVVTATVAASLRERVVDRVEGRRA